MLISLHAYYKQTPFPSFRGKEEYLLGVPNSCLHLVVGSIWMPFGPKFYFFILLFASPMVPEFPFDS